MTYIPFEAPSIPPAELIRIEQRDKRKSDLTPVEKNREPQAYELPKMPRLR